MSHYSLLRRIKSGPKGYDGRASDADLRDAVLEHLRVICTTRRGTMPVCPDYGVCDLTELLDASDDGIAEMTRAIKETIDKYEPRLTNVRVTRDRSNEANALLRFEITAQLVGPNWKSPVMFETTVDATRRVKVR